MKIQCRKQHDLTHALRPSLWLLCGWILGLGLELDHGFFICKMGVWDVTDSNVHLALSLSAVFTVILLRTLTRAMHTGEVNKYTLNECLLSTHKRPALLPFKKSALLDLEGHHHY